MFLKEKTTNLRKINKKCVLAVLGSKSLGDHLAKEDTQIYYLSCKYNQNWQWAATLHNPSVQKKSIMPEM